MMFSRVAVIGAQAHRVAKVLSLLRGEDDTMNIDFLSLVASFESYKDENGNDVRYLSALSYHGTDGKNGGENIVKLIDKITKDEDDKECPIALFAIGCGIEYDQDVQQIKLFLKNFWAKIDMDTFHCIKPNPGFKTMQEETNTFRNLDREAKLRATIQQTIGPGKMAKFVSDLVQDLKLSLLVQEEEEEDTDHIDQQNEDEENIMNAIQSDASQNRYACRICRKVLFREEDLEDPPHIPAKHNFGWKNQASITSHCQSLFLKTELPWMGNLSASEGKFCCLYCGTKLGNWKWAGAQCSCGTWVVPAIQVPKSKVDLVRAVINADKII